MLIIQHEPGHCKSCNKKINSLASADPEFEQIPKPGDYVVCWYCGEISMMDDEFNFRPLTADELNYLKTEEPEAFAIIKDYSNKVKTRILPTS